MQMQFSLDFLPKDGSKRAVVSFGELLQKMWRNLASLVINGHISFGDGINRDNIDGNWANLVTPAAPNTDFVVNHNLGRLPVGYLITYKDRAVDVYTGSVAATFTQITLRATVASAVIRLFIFCLVLFFGVSTQAQTTVNLTVQDTTPTLWTGPWTVSLLPPSGVTPPFNPTIVSGGGSLATQTGTLSSGTATISLPANANIAPSNTHWLFNVCFSTTGICFTQIVTISTSSPQTLLITPPPPIPVSGGGGSSGGGFPVTTNVAVNTGGSINISGTGSINGITAGQTPVMKAIFPADPKYGVKADGKVFFSNVNSCTFTGAIATFTCTGAAFTQSDAGKLITATINGCCGVANAYLGIAALPKTSLTTILSVQDATHATASQNFTQSSGANWIISWGTNDDAAMTAAETDAGSTNKCGSIIMPAGLIFLTGPHFNTPGANCLGAEPQADYTMNVSGQGIGATIIVLPTGFNKAACLTGGTNGCFGTYPESSLHDFQFNGFGWGDTGFTGATSLLAAELGSQWSQISCASFGGSDLNLTGIVMGTGARFWGLTIDGCGGIGGNVAASIVKCYYCFFGDTLSANLSVAGDITDYGSDYGGAGQTLILAIAGSGRYHGIGSNLFTCGATNTSGINIGTSGGPTAVVILDGGRWNCGSTTSNGVFMNSTQKLILTGGTIVGGTLNAVSRGASATVFTSPDTVFANGAITSLAPACTFSTGGGTSPSCATQAGSTNEKGVIIATTGTGAPGSTGTITLTFAGTYAGASGATPACTYTLDNSGTAWGAESVAFVNTQSTTAPTIAWTNIAAVTLTALTVSSPYRIDYTCVAR